MILFSHCPSICPSVCYGLVSEQGVPNKHWLLTFFAYFDMSGGP